MLNPQPRQNVWRNEAGGPSSHAHRGNLAQQQQPIPNDEIHIRRAVDYITQAHGQRPVEPRGHGTSPPGTISPQSPEGRGGLAFDLVNPTPRSIVRNTWREDEPRGRRSGNWAQSESSNSSTNQMPIRKTPAALLNEMVHFTSPTFDFRVDGPDQSPLFEVTIKTACVQTGKQYEAQGIGKTKKDAKQDAARNVLLEIDSRLEQLIISPPPPPPRPVLPQVSASSSVQNPNGSPTVEPTSLKVDPEVDCSSIGILNTICMKLKISPPEYKEIKSQVPGAFAIECSIGVALSETGIGLTKKMAKRVAANKVVQKCLSVLRTPTEANDILPLPEQGEIRSKLVQFVEEASTSPTGKKGIERIEYLKSLGVTDLPNNEAAVPVQALSSLETFSQLVKSWTGEKLDQFLALSEAELKQANIMELFQGIVDEQGLRINIFDIPTLHPAQLIPSELTLVSPSSAQNPGEKTIISFLGFGKSVQNSHRDAAYRCLQLLKVVLGFSAQQ